MPHGPQHTIPGEVIEAVGGIHQEEDLRRRDRLHGGGRVSTAGYSVASVVVVVVAVHITVLLCEDGDDCC